MGTKEKNVHLGVFDPLRENGRRVATLWSFPFEVDVGPWLQAGENELRIEVSNLAFGF
jgi:hypothetical protein